MTSGDDVQVNLAVSARADVDVAEATIRWVSRWPYHSRVWTFLPARLSSGWSNELRKEVDNVVSSARLSQLSGLLAGGSRTEARVRMETVDVAASSVMTAGFGSVLNQVEARLLLRDGTEIKQHRRVWVRPRHTELSAIAPDPAQRDGGVIQVRGSDGTASLYGELYRPLEGTLVLRAGAEDLGPGKADLTLTRNAQWQVHYMVRARGRALTRRDWQEKTMERQVSRESVKLGAVATPPIPAHGRAEIRFSLPGPRGTAQSTECPEGFISWSLDCAWSAGRGREEVGTPIVISMPAVSRRELDGGQRRRWAWLGRRGSTAGMEASTGTA